MRVWCLLHACLLFVSVSAHVYASDMSLEQRYTATQPLPQEIKLTLANALPFARSAEPASCGVPLVRGFVR